MKTSNALEREIETALLNAGLKYSVESENPHHLDFDLPEFKIAIEVKKFHSDRISKQMARVPNVIVAQGILAIRFLANAIQGKISPPDAINDGSVPVSVVPSSDIDINIQQTLLTIEKVLIAFSDTTQMNDYQKEVIGELIHLSQSRKFLKARHF